MSTPTLDYYRRAVEGARADLRRAAAALSRALNHSGGLSLHQIRSCMREVEHEMVKVDQAELEAVRSLFGGDS
jgi:hypothetical protein